MHTSQKRLPQFLIFFSVWRSTLRVAVFYIKPFQIFLLASRVTMTCECPEPEYQVNGWWSRSATLLIFLAALRDFEIVRDLSFSKHPYWINSTQVPGLYN